MRCSVLLAGHVMLVGGCDRILGLAPPGPAIDARSDARNTTWSAPIATGLVGDDPTLTPDLLELYFEPAAPGGSVHFVKRAAIGAPWQLPPTVVGAIDSASETTPNLSPDGLSIYFASARPGIGDYDIWIATRPSLASAEWSPPMNVAELNSSAYDADGSPDANGLAILLTSQRDDPMSDVYLSRRSSPTQPWGTPVSIGGSINTAANDSSPFLSADGLTLMFVSKRNAGGDSDLYESRRDSFDEPFVDVTAIAELNTTFTDEDPWMSADGRYLFFASDRDGSTQIYYATRY